jgi:predicted MPP superfamily phosphohydrolase
LSIFYSIVYIIVVPLIAIYGYFKANKIKVVEHELYFNDLKEDISLVHFSDVHIGSIRGEKLLKNIAETVNSLCADVAVISGDLADGSTPIVVDDFIPLKDIKIPVIFTPGNHDHYPGLANVIKAAEKADLKVLLNEKIEFKGVSIYGFLIHSRLKPGVSIENSVDFLNMNYEEFNIVVNHYPTNWDEFREMGVDIQLSGHTHGGQFYPVTFLIKSMFKYVRGVYKEKEENKYLIVSDGVGTYQAPIRWGTNSEIVLLKLKKGLKRNVRCS